MSLTGFALLFGDQRSLLSSPFLSFPSQVTFHLIFLMLPHFLPLLYSFHPQVGNGGEGKAIVAISSSISS